MEEDAQHDSVHAVKTGAAKPMTTERGRGRFWGSGLSEGVCFFRTNVLEWTLLMWALFGTRDILRKRL